MADGYNTPRGREGRLSAYSGKTVGAPRDRSRSPDEAPSGRLQPSETKEEEEAIYALLDLGDDKGRVQLEAYMLSLEIERVSGALGRLPPSVEGGRRHLKHGGGEIANRAYKWLMSTIGAGAGAAMVASVAAPETTAALVELGTALAATPDAARSAADAAAAKAIRTAIPAAQTLGSFATAGVGLAGASYLFNHPSLVVGVGDIATRIAVTIGGASGALGPNWATFIHEGTAIGKMVLNASGNAAITIASRPYLIAAISYVLLAEYAKTKNKSVYQLISDSSKAVGSRMVNATKDIASRVASSAKAAASSTASDAIALGEDVKSVVSATLDDFNKWLEQGPNHAALVKLGQVTKTAIAERARVAAEETFKTARAERAARRAAVAAAEQRDAAIASAVAPLAPGGEEARAMEEARGPPQGQGGQGRRLTSRRRRRASAPRRTRRSSFGRRQGGSRRRRE